MDGRTERSLMQNRSYCMRAMRSGLNIGETDRSPTDLRELDRVIPNTLSRKIIGEISKRLNDTCFRLNRHLTILVCLWICEDDGSGRCRDARRPVTYTGDDCT